MAKGDKLISIVVQTKCHLKDLKCHFLLFLFYKFLVFVGKIWD